MKSDLKDPAEIPSAADCAEAAAWIARLHGEDRTAQVEAGFRRWLAASATHRTAFEMASDLWNSAERWPKPRTPPMVRRPPAFALAAAAVVATVLIAGAFYYFHSWNPGIATQVGEQRSLTLEDGTRVFLNTATRIRPQYDRTARRVELAQGEALFEVARHADRPFIVSAGGKQVTALGTAFVVKLDRQNVEVTLVEGKVAVEEARGKNRQVLSLTPGQRLKVAGDRSPRIDTPSLNTVTAWQRGQVVLDHTSLADAVAEMNRYSGVRLEIENAAAAGAQVTGVFRTGDSTEFARAVAETYGLEVVEKDERIVLAGAPRRGGF